MFCRIHKFIISGSIDNGNRLWFLTKRHIDRCPDCVDFLDLCLKMDNRLKLDSNLIFDNPAGILPESILDNDAFSGKSSFLRTVSIRSILTVAACLAVVTLPVVTLMIYRSNLSINNKNHYDLAVSSLQYIYTSGSRLAGRITGDQKPFSSIVQQPLESEIKNLAADTQSALRFLIASVDVTAAQTDSLRD